MAAPAQTGFTWADLQAFPEDGVRREIIGGVLHVSAAPAPRHQRVVLRLGARLVAYVDEQGGDVFTGPNTYFGDDDVVEPDLVLLRADHTDRVVGLTVRGPDLVVELASPSTRRYDLGEKRRLYERMGVPEFWFVDLEVDRVEVYVLDGDSYADPVLLGRGDPLTSARLSGLTIDVSDALGPAE
ncbi:MAG: Uma2 family endonuclease [Euzebyales bacterium]|jgi:Uma2 family endonuclease|nr:Uma2 family endonuclease [Euzebyales bacterium]